jgi:hypothetical protein
MKCPTCQKEMNIVQKSITFNPDKGKKYGKTSFVCEKDDVSITLEIPIPEKTLTT